MSALGQKRTSAISLDEDAFSMHISVRAPEKACAGRQRIRPEELAVE
jgi:hypothetical protein